MTIEPTNLAAQLHHRAAGNPPSTLPSAAISNCFPGLEFDFRNVWRRVLEGIELHECSGLVVSADAEHAGVAGLYLLEVAGHPTRMELIARSGQPAGLDFMEWSNALAEVVAAHSGELVECRFDADRDRPVGTVTAQLRVRALFEHSAVAGALTAVIAEAVAQPGELTQSLCSPWQNDYVECACYYWAASRPDYVNVEQTPEGTRGEAWLDVTQETYGQLFREWQAALRFIVGGSDAGG